MEDSQLLPSPPAALPFGGARVQLPLWVPGPVSGRWVSQLGTLFPQRVRGGGPPCSSPEAGFLVEKFPSCSLFRGPI